MKKRSYIFIVLIITMAIGYASLNTNMQLAGTALLRTNIDLMVTGVEVSNVVGNPEEIEKADYGT